MSLSVNHLILHQIVQDQENTLEIHHRKDELALNASSEALVAELHRTFNTKPAKGFANFISESDFKTNLQAFSSKELDFIDFSVKSAQKLVAELTKYPFADAGTFVIAEYQSLATEYLFLGFLTSQSSVKITDDLELSHTAYLDINKMDIAARIDLSTWKSEPESNRYLSFIKGRVGRKVADFFLDFLQAEIGMDTKEQNQVLIQAVEDFCTDARLEKEEKQAYRENVYNYCNEQLKAGEEVSVKELAMELPQTEEGSNFLQYTEDQGYELEESFPVDRGSLRRFKKFVGAGGGVSISFEGELLSERVFYDMETDTLTIKGTPPNLRDQLQRRLSSDID